ncbi:uncharacterized protein LOC107885026 [Acyrthosiphon pisum]|uniref:Uncharacterized protein n=1 Tax=Acyrthosiphon pisum TaxID=7029 RepID=A0A8R2JXH7_ACYPI|nr:uncharacterized protein LOC107885026 [Acyrthosiphon pisum]|eukprot:XP_016663813.1 PREDICTED: uncharacterized protein LOC107885026 [Acyrthosiphon pisum]
MRQCTEAAGVAAVENVTIAMTMAIFRVTASNPRSMAAAEAEAAAEAIPTGVIGMTAASRTPGPDPDHAQKRAEDLLWQLSLVTRLMTKLRGDVPPNGKDPPALTHIHSRAVRGRVPAGRGLCPAGRGRGPGPEVGRWK